jgi:hypothetical protein
VWSLTLLLLELCEVELIQFSADQGDVLLLCLCDAPSPSCMCLLYVVCLRLAFGAGGFLVLITETRGLFLVMLRRFPSDFTITIQLEAARRVCALWCVRVCVVVKHNHNPRCTVGVGVLCLITSSKRVSCLARVEGGDSEIGNVENAFFTSGLCCQIRRPRDL